MIEAHDCQAALPRLAACGNVIVGVNQVTGGRIGPVSCSGKIAGRKRLVAWGLILGLTLGFATDFVLVAAGA